MVDEKKIDELVTAAVMADLEGLEFLTEFDYATLCRQYNGIGPEWAGAAIRAKVTQYLALFEPAALIHDLRNYMSDGGCPRATGRAGASTSRTWSFWRTA